MAFTVPDEEPALPRGLAAGDNIAAPSMNRLLLRDRYLFATRRRLLVSLPKVVTASASYVVAYRCMVKTLPTATDTISIGIVGVGNVDVRVNTLYGIVALSTGAIGADLDTISGVPNSTWFEILIEVRTTSSPTPGTVHGIYIVENILDAADLP
jgi:hypothetical protein